jgi:hypothetical protein
LRIFLILLIFSSNLYSQSFSEPLDFKKEDNRFVLSSDKLQNIYNFSNQFQYTNSFDFGTIHLIQNYTGNGTPTTSIRSYQENQNLKFQYLFEITDDLYFFNKDNWFLSSNTLNFGQNKLERLNLLLGTMYKTSNSKWIDFGYGKERNTTIGLETVGDYVSSNFEYFDIEFEGFDINSRGYYEQVILNDGRENNDINLNFLTSKEFENDSRLFLSMTLLNRGRDNPEINPLISDILIRRRKQSRINTISTIEFILSNNFINQFSLGFNNEDVSNSFNNNYSEIQDTEFKRQIDIFEYDIQNTLNFITEDINTRFFLNFRKLNEDYEAVNFLNIADEKFDAYRLEQNRQDKIETFFKINIDNGVSITDTDSLSLILDYRLLRYDTPSENNNDDRDEQLINFKIRYLSEVDNNLSMGIELESRNYHYVYLKAQRSSSNNWNRILRLSPTFILDYNGFYYNPKLSINANYTTYDFENTITAVNSFSFREISYFDTLQIKLTSDLNIETRSHLKYSERGILYWDSFSEQPQRSNYEYYQNLLLIKREENNNLGIGIRYFRRKDTRLGTLTRNNSNILNDFESIAPQVLFVHNFESGNSINFDLWYEFQRINQTVNQELVNFYLTLNVLI